MRGPKRHAEAPHEVSDHHCGGPADPLLAVHQDAASIHDGLVHPLQGPVEQQGDILLVAVLQVICDVAEVLREAALTEIGSHVHDVGDPVPSEALQVGSNLVTGDVESVRENLGARRPVAIQPQVLEKMVGQMVIVLLVVRVVGVDKLLLGHVDLLQVQHRRRIGTLRDRWARGAHCRRFQGKRRQGALLPLRLGLGGASRLGGPWGCGFASAGSAQSTQAQARHHRAAPCRCGTDALCLRSAQRPQAQARHHRCRARPRPLHALGELCRTSFEIEAPGLGRTALSGELIRRGDCRFLLFLLLVLTVLALLAFIIILCIRWTRSQICRRASRATATAADGGATAFACSTKPMKRAPHSARYAWEAPAGCNAAPLGGCAPLPCKALQTLGAANVFR
mmetsp:Transcript_53509/g.115047  ORF Transcript_53509/g.115047 Transcript_53509/m.115047 type:complete len:395 (-) Transcript_53509:879-2063(-)